MSGQNYTENGTHLTALPGGGAEISSPEYWSRFAEQMREAYRQSARAVEIRPAEEG